MRALRLRAEGAAKAALAAPFFMLLLLFAYGPIGVAAWQGFGPAGAGLPPMPIEATLSRPDVLSATLLTVGFLVIKIAVNVGLGLLLALALWGDGRLKRIARFALLLPTLISVVILGVVVIFLFDREVGLANLLVTAFGIERQSWLLQPASTQWIITGFSIWRDQGLIVFVFLAGLAAVPQQVLEAAAIDGATRLQSLLLVTLPLLVRSTGFATIFSLYMGAQFIAPILQITQGGPRGATTLMPFLIYQEAFEYFDYRSASALSLFFILVVLAVAGLVGWLTRPRWSY